MTTWIISGILAFITGGVFIWFTKDRIQQAVLGANALSAKLRAKADAIAQAVRKV